MENSLNLEKTQSGFDEDKVESLFQRIFIENENNIIIETETNNEGKEDNKDIHRQEKELSFDFQDSNFQLKCSNTNKNNDEILIISTPQAKRKKLETQYCHQEQKSYFENYMNQNIMTFRDGHLEEDVEVEAAKRYLRIYTTPLYRWSMDMIPDNLINKKNQTYNSYKTENSALSKKRRERLFRQHITRASKSFEDEFFLLSSLESYQNLNVYDDENEEDDGKDGDEEEETNSIFQNLDKGSSIPVIVSGDGSGINNNFLVKSSNSKASWIVERMRHLVKAYSDRGDFVRKVLEEFNANASRSDDDIDQDSDNEDQGDPNQKQKKKQTDSIVFESIFSEEWRNDIVSSEVEELRGKFFKYIDRKYLKNVVYEPQSLTYIIWLLIVSLTFLYNAILIPYHLVFPFHQQEKWRFVLLNIFADFIYLVDICWFKPRLKFLKSGHWIVSVRETHRNYFNSTRFYLLDLLAQLPLDWFWFFLIDPGSLLVSTTNLLLRLNRLIKIRDFWEFFERIDKATKNPYLFRIIHTLMYELYIIHLGTCLYYRVSETIGFGRTPWTYNNQGNAYLRCFYFAFRTTTSIGGRLPKPTTEFERIYMMIAWLLGVFVFAMVIGQIRDIVAHASRNQNYYIDALNKIAAHMNRLSVPNKLQKRVRFWYKFTWDLQKTFNEMEIIRVLPLKMRTDLMLFIHSHTLSRVDLFKNINRSVLRDLILKLQPILFLPGDYVCRKGDVGHEMYIVNKGTIQVLDSQNRRVLATLGEGSVFGEIAILNLHGQTKRTADVRSCGYSQLFALKKQDLWETLRYYPEYQNILKRKVQRILRRKRQQAMKTMNIDDQQSKESKIIINSNEKIKDCGKNRSTSVTDQIQVEPILKGRPRTPRLFKTVMEAIRPDSTLNQYFSRSKCHSHSLKVASSPKKEHWEDEILTSQSGFRKQKNIDYDVHDSRNNRRNFSISNP